jgi:adenylate cyclase
MTKYSFDTKKIIIYTLIILALLGGYYYNTYNMIDNFIYDNYQKLEYIFSSKDKNSEVTIVSINQLTYNKLGDWPLDRNYYVDAIEKLTNDGANIIAFNLLFDEAQDAQADSLMIDRLRDNKNIVMPVQIDYSLASEESKTDYTVNEVRSPLSSFKNLVKLGHINFISEPDGKIRNLPPLFIDNNTSYIPLSRRAAEMALEEEITITEGKYLINYLGPSGTLPQIALHDYLNDNYKPELIQDKIILFGITEGERASQYLSIFANDTGFSEVELLAQMTNNYLHQNYIEVNETGRNILIAFVVLWLIFYLFEKLHPLRSLAALTVITAVIISLNYYLTVQYYLFTEISIYLVGIAVLYTASIITWYGFDRKRKYEIIKKLSPYLSQFLLNKIVQNPALLKSEGDKSAVTMMLFEFSNFKWYADQNSSQKVIEDLNHYYRNISKIIFKYDGVIDKYLGDGILAYWNKGFEQENHRNRAVKAAIEIMNYIEKEEIELKPSIALDSGQVILGDIGSKERMDFKAMGNIVHNTTELVEVTEPYEVLIGENTYYGLSDIYKKLEWKYKEVEIEGVKRSFVVYSLKEFKSFSKGE